MIARVNFLYAKERKKEEKRKMCVRIVKENGGGLEKWNASRRLRWNKKWWRAIRSNYDLPFRRVRTSSEHATRVLEDEASRDRD